MRTITSLLIGILCIAVLSTAAWASTTPPPADTLKVDYFSNANTMGAPDGTLRISNPGTGGNSAGNVWAAIYVFDPNQELSECCECFLSPDDLRTLSINTDLTSNPLTSVVLTTGLIKVVSTTGPSGAKLYPTPAIRSWATHIQDTTFAVTETASPDATLSAAEQSRLQRECSSIQLDGSGHGICTCGTGD